MKVKRGKLIGLTNRREERVIRLDLLLGYWTNVFFRINIIRIL